MFAVRSRVVRVDCVHTFDPPVTVLFVHELCRFALESVPSATRVLVSIWEHAIRTFARLIERRESSALNRIARCCASASQGHMTHLPGRDDP